jgi:hypothetical protein
MQIQLEVTYKDGAKQTATAEFPDLCEFERKFDRSVLKLTDELRLSDFGFLAWHALKRTNLVFTDYGDWANMVTMVTAVADDGNETIRPLD